MSLNALKWSAILCFIIAMAILLGGGVKMKDSLPPYPGTCSGRMAAVVPEGGYL